ncbi:MAG: DUF2269 domain-containing protein [Proteobacteria bacterium]|nr:DUF2269 domain-containing protein [Pseudomonadota bacterium]MCP4916149.1 DUF2269 domain-containing protein [Pseudomonadota bacterium]
MVPLIKSVHVLGAVLFLGTGLGSAWYKWRADRAGDVRIVAWCQREIVLADWVFTVPSGILMPLTGGLLVHLYGLPWSTPWVQAAIGLYVVAGLCWLPAAGLQLKMRRLADEAVARATELPPEFHAANRIWLALGFPAFLASIAAVWVMVAKPLF